MNGLFKIVLFLLAGLGLASTCFAHKVFFEDFLVSRIQSRQIMFTQLNTYQKHLKKFTCLFDQSHILNLAQLTPAQVSELGELEASKAKEKPEFLKKFIRVILLQVYNNSMQLELGADFDLQFPLKKCDLGRFASWDNELKSLVQAELYLRNLKSGAFVVNKSTRKTYFEQVEEKIDYEFFL